MSLVFWFMQDVLGKYTLKAGEEVQWLVYLKLWPKTAKPMIGLEMCPLLVPPTPSCMVISNG